jgi:hypothetical protein
MTRRRSIPILFHITSYEHEKESDRQTTLATLRGLICAWLRDSTDRMMLRHEAGAHRLYLVRVQHQSVRIDAAIDEPALLLVGVNRPSN